MPKRARKSKSSGEEEESLPVIFTNNRLVDYSDSEDDDDQIRLPPRKKKRAIQSSGYPNQKNYSIKAARWIQSLAKKSVIEIWHALNGGEQKIHGHYVDGYHPGSKTIFEFHGCYWHGCPTHFPDRNTRNRHNCMTMEQLYRQTVEKTQTLECYGYRVIELWECEYDKKYTEDSEFR